MEFLINNGIQKSYNGGWKQYIIFTNNDSKFKIDILCENFPSQSYVILEKWIDNYGWKQVVRSNPVIDFKLEINHNDVINTDYFKVIIDNMIEISENF